MQFVYNAREMKEEKRREYIHSKERVRAFFLPENGHRFYVVRALFSGVVSAVLGEHNDRTCKKQIRSLYFRGWRVGLI